MTRTGSLGGEKRPPVSGNAAAGPFSWKERQRRAANEPGLITVPDGEHPASHELDTARRLARLGADVAFRTLVNAEGVKNPDITLDGEVWEMKAPQGSSEKSTIASQFKRGRRQCTRLVIDLVRCGLPDDLALAQIRRRFDGQDRIEQVLVIDHQGFVTHLRR